MEQSRRRARAIAVAKAADNTAQRVIYATGASLLVLATIITAFALAG